MPEILVISGKGGTGKTSLTAAFAHLAQEQVICDLDVDAPDLHLLLRPQHQRVEEFISGHEAVIDPQRCTDCGLCQKMCRYRAIERVEGLPRVIPNRCEGCKVCVHFCPEQAIDFPQSHCGTWYISQTRFGPMVHARLLPGAENSGHLVALLRDQAKELAQNQGRRTIICDGTPGIGCPVISSLSGTDLAVVVTEPTPSGRHDLERVMELCRHFRVPAAVIINKADLNPDQSREIEAYCRREEITLAARLPFDPAMTQAMLEGKAITEYQDNGLAGRIGQAWQIINQMAQEAVKD